MEQQTEEKKETKRMEANDWSIGLFFEAIWMFLISIF